jgi:hypothetical protein
MSGFSDIKLFAPLNCIHSVTILLIDIVSTSTIVGSKLDSLDFKFGILNFNKKIKSTLKFRPFNLNLDPTIVDVLNASSQYFRFL